jgi:hypothetical protein
LLTIKCLKNLKMYNNLKEFIENVKPFSNASEACSWHNYNCEDCDRYESESTDRDKAGCKLAFDLDRGFVIGEIPLSTAKVIGYVNVNDSKKVTLKARCNKYKCELNTVQ